MDLPTGSEVEVSLTEDESRNIRAVAYFPLLDAEFEATFVGETFQYSLKELQERFDAVKALLSEIKSFHAGRPRDDVQGVLDTIQQTQLTEAMTADLARAAAGERESEVRAYKRLLELEGSVREMHKRQQRDRIQVGIGNLRVAVTDSDRQALEDIEREYGRAESAEDVEKCFRSLSRLEFSVRGRPYVELAIDVMALGGLKVTAVQNKLFDKAATLLNRMEAKGGQAKLTDSDIAELEDMHRQLRQGYPDLSEHREKKLRELNVGRGDVELSHLTRR
jgi:hypothetical protein